MVGETSNLNPYNAGLEYVIFEKMRFQFDTHPGSARNQALLMSAVEWQ